VAIKRSDVNETLWPETETETSQERDQDLLRDAAFDMFTHLRFGFRIPTFATTTLAAVRDLFIAREHDNSHGQ